MRLRIRRCRDLLQTLGIPVMEPYAEKNLEPRPDLVIVGNAISRGNVELEYVLDQRIPFRSMAQTVYEEFLTGRESLVVAGTHGKTTTTSMLAWIYETAARMRGELGPSFLIGGVAENFGTSFQVCARARASSSKAMSTTRPSSTRGRSSCTTFRMPRS